MLSLFSPKVPGFVSLADASYEIAGSLLVKHLGEGGLDDGSCAWHDGAAQRRSRGISACHLCRNVVVAFAETSALKSIGGR